MKTLKARFEEKFPKQKLFVRENSNEFSNLKSTEELLTFIKQELMLLAEEVEGTLRTRYHDKSDQDRQDKGHNIGVVNAATIIRTRAESI